MKSAGLTITRANPPTNSFFEIVDKLESLEVDNKLIYLSHHRDSDNNPLDYSTKLAFLKTFINGKYNDIEVVNSIATTIKDILKELSNDFSSVKILIREDKKEDLEELIKEYKKEDLADFIQVDIVTLDSDHMEEDPLYYAEKNDYENFSSLIPSDDDLIKKELFKSIRKGMKIKEFIKKEDPIIKRYEIPLVTSWTSDLDYYITENNIRYQLWNYDYSIENILSRIKDTIDLLLSNRKYGFNILRRKVGMSSIDIKEVPLSSKDYHTKEETGKGYEEDYFKNKNKLLLEITLLYKDNEDFDKYEEKVIDLLYILSELNGPYPVTYLDDYSDEGLKDYSLFYNMLTYEEKKRVAKIKTLF